MKHKIKRKNILLIKTKRKKIFSLFKLKRKKRSLSLSLLKLKEKN